MTVMIVPIGSPPCWQPGIFIITGVPTHGNAATTRAGHLSDDEHAAILAPAFIPRSFAYFERTINNGRPRRGGENDLAREKWKEREKVKRRGKKSERKRERQPGQ